jgi:hypothetical protein
MPRLTINLSTGMHRALKEEAARRGLTIGRIIEQSLELAGVKTSEQAEELLARARARSGLREEEALRLAVAETRRVRRR